MSTGVRYRVSTSVGYSILIVDSDMLKHHVDQTPCLANQVLWDQTAKIPCGNGVGSYVLPEWRCKRRDHEHT